ncbi:hypothetical protein LXT21_03795 [Myxococcus sp. K38C18041901]|uniref:hypothetical protein n=1 Tax=Myxococcus guangdongensis TaxID=2906760 RepID=UPI0020A7280A|nr:hypothetical protein [Myxococcus guangdongensis]MCP3057894.1 hypothetical protein [Myxococcus guangdongensis]
MKPITRRRASQRGQAMMEYTLLLTLMVLSTMLAFGGWPFTQRLFQALQSYVDLYFFALDLAVG